LMAGTTYLEHTLPWDGEMPLLNLCVFDDSQIIITFSSRSWENPYQPVPGIWIKHKEIARFFRERYYDKIVEYAESKRSPPRAKEKENGVRHYYERLFG